MLAQSHAWRKPKNDKIDSGLCQKWPTAYLQGKLSHCKLQIRDETRPFLAGDSPPTGIFLIDVSVLGSILDRGISMGRRNHLTPGFLSLQVCLVLDQLEFRRHLQSRALHLCLFEWKGNFGLVLALSQLVNIWLNHLYIGVNVVCLQVNIEQIIVCLNVNIVCLQVTIVYLHVNIWLNIVY